MKEVWNLIKVVSVSNDRYRKGDALYVSSLGRCRVNDTIVELNNRYKYPKFGNKRIHRLVYESFIGEIPEGYEIDHIDTDTRNNRIENLRIVTKKGNMNNPLTKEKLSYSHKGITPWNKGKTGMKSKRFVWLTKDNELKILTKNIAAQFYPEYILIEQLL